MCNRIAIDKRIDKIEKRMGGGGNNNQLNVKADAPVLKQAPSYYYSLGFDHQEMMLYTSNLGWQKMSWGLIPDRIGEHDLKKVRAGTLNARSEDVFDRVSYRIPIFNGRCLLPVSGFFEFRTYNSKKYPYFIYRPGNDVFCLGCIFNHSINSITQKWEYTFSIVTTPANNLMGKIHNEALRMPLILFEDYWDAWLDGKLSENEIKSLMIPYQGELFAHTVSQEVNSTKFNNNHYNITDPVQYSIPPIYMKSDYSDTIILL